MSMVPVALQVLALICLILAAFALKLPHVDAVGWLGLALYVAAALWAPVLGFLAKL